MTGLEHITKEVVMAINRLRKRWDLRYTQGLFLLSRWPFNRLPRTADGSLERKKTQTVSEVAIYLVLLLHVGQRPKQTKTPMQVDCEVMNIVNTMRPRFSFFALAGMRLYPIVDPPNPEHLPDAYG